MRRLRRLTAMQKVERGDKVALIYSDANREEKYTFLEMKLQSNRFGNVLRKLGVQKGDRVFLFMPRSPGVVLQPLGILKVGAIAGPLFEAFMEAAVKDRLENSEAVALVTTPDLLQRVPCKELRPEARDSRRSRRGATRRWGFTAMKRKWRKLPVSWKSNGWIGRTG